jgi:nicotinate-nucleotide adenylyltransferase
VRLGLYGGSFDPPHVGHLLVAGDAAEALGLDRLIWVPTFAQPLKAGRAATPAATRLAMVRAAVAGDPRFEVSAVEIERGGLSYTVDTLAAVADAYPTAERFLVIGLDSVGTFERWREPARIMELATVVVLQRATDAPAPSLRAGMRPVTTRRVDVSSTEVRERVRTGKPISGFVPDAVARLIEQARLYR